MSKADPADTARTNPASTEAVEKSFVAALQHHVQTKLNDRLSEERKLELYGTYKQASQGPCTYERPNEATVQPAILAKWKAWRDVSWMTREQAAVQYIVLVGRFDPAWTPPFPIDPAHVGLGPDGKPSSRATGTESAPKASAPSAAEEPASAAVPSPRKVPDEALFSGVLEGVLYKQRDFMNGWRPRHFRLEDQMLHYYLDANDPTPRKSLLVANCTITPLPDMINTSPTDGEQRATFYTFVISHPESSKQYKLAATSAIARNRWIDALTAAAEQEQSIFAVASERSSSFAGGDVRGTTAGAAGPIGDLGAASDADGPYGERIETAMRKVIDEAMSRTGFDSLGTKNDVQGFRKTLRGGLPCVLGEGVIEASVPATLESLLDLNLKLEYDAQFGSGRRVRVLNPHTYIDHLKFKPTWPTSARDLVVVTSWRRVQLPPVSGQGPNRPAIVMVAFSVPAVGESTQPQPSFVRAELMLSGWILRAGPGGKGTHCNYLVSMDLKGSLPRALMISEHAFLIAALRNAMESRGIDNTDTEGSMDNEQLEARTAKHAVELATTDPGETRPSNALPPAPALSSAPGSETAPAASAGLSAVVEEEVVGSDGADGVDGIVGH